MPVSLYSQQSCSFVVTPVLVTQNASKLVIIGLTKNIVDYSRGACKFWKVQTTTVEDLEGGELPPLPLGDGLTPSLTVLLIVTALLYYGDTNASERSVEILS